MSERASGEMDERKMRKLETTRTSMRVVRYYANERAAIQKLKSSNDKRRAEQERGDE